MSIIQLPVSDITFRTEYVHERSTRSHREPKGDNGVNAPIVVTRVNGTYELVDGFSQAQAYKSSKTKTIPAVVVDYTNNPQVSCLQDRMDSAKSVYDKVTTFSELVRATTINRKVLAHITGLSAQTITYLAESIKLDTKALLLLKDPAVAKVFTITYLAKLAMKDLPADIQPNVMTRLTEVAGDLGKGAVLSLIDDLPNLEAAIKRAYENRNSVESAMKKSLRCEREANNAVVKDTERIQVAVENAFKMSIEAAVEKALRIEREANEEILNEYINREKIAQQKLLMQEQDTVRLLIERESSDALLQVSSVCGISLGYLQKFIRENDPLVCFKKLFNMRAHEVFGGESYIREPVTDNIYVLPGDLSSEEFNYIRSGLGKLFYCLPEKCADCPICMFTNARNVVRCKVCNAPVCPNCVEKLVLESTSDDLSCPFCRGVFR